MAFLSGFAFFLPWTTILWKVWRVPYPNPCTFVLKSTCFNEMNQSYLKRMEMGKRDEKLFTLVSSLPSGELFIRIRWVSKTIWSNSLTNQTVWQVPYGIFPDVIQNTENNNKLGILCFLWKQDVFSKDNVKKQTHICRILER